MNLSIQGEIINSFSDFDESSIGTELRRMNLIGGQGELVESRYMVVGTHPGEQETPASDEQSEGVKKISGNEPPQDEMPKHSPLERAHGLIRGLLMILQHHGASKAATDSFKTQAYAYLVCDDERTFFKRAKYLTVAPMASYLKCEKPKVPDLDWVPVGQFRNWAKTRLRVFNRKNTHLWYSWLQSKRSALPLSDDLVLTTYEEHRAAMEIEDPIDDETLDSVMKELRPVLEKIRQELRQTYDTDGRQSDWLAPEETSYVASTSASYEKSRAGGGQLGALLRHVPNLVECNPLNKTDRRKLPDLCRMTFYPRVVIGGVLQFNCVVEEYAYASGEVEWYNSVRRSCVSYAKEQRELKATIQAVLEPLKVRVISKGEAFPYYASKKLQKELHSIMRRMDCFRLIGAPLGATDLIDLARNPVEIGEGQLEWFSIDYSAATDKLSARLSAAILSFLIEGQDEAMQNVWKAVLAPHRCEYPPVSGVTLDSVKQRNGQLMGSILSFPILCLANLGLYLETIKEDSRPLKRKLKGVLVNGDDMLYVSATSLWKKHIEVGSKVGLTMSPGKAYHHPVYANANSACYHFDLNRFDPNNAVLSSTPWYIPFLNTGLYFGQNKVLASDVENTKSWTSVIDKLVSGALPGRQHEVMAMYLNRHAGPIREECAGRNLFIPKSLGGMGVTPVDGFSYEITVEQRVLAQRFMDENPHAITEQFPWREANSAPLVTAPEPLKAPWLAGLYFDRPGLRDPKRSEISTYSNMLRAIRRGLSRGEPFTMARGRLDRPLLVSSALRVGAKPVLKLPVPDAFRKQKERDTLLEYAESQEVEDWCPPSTWTIISNSLDYALSMDGPLC